MIIRAATSADVPAVAAIMNHVINHTTATFTTVTKSETQVATEITPPQQCLVAVTDDIISGYARFFPFRSGPGYAHVAEYSIAITDPAQDCGTGRTLFSGLCEIARNNGVEQLIGAVSGDNVAAIAFHRAMGFDQVGHLADAGRKWGKSLDLIFMQKRL